LRFSVGRWLVVLYFAPLLLSVPLFPQSQPIEGTYTGTLQAGEARLHLVLHLSKTSSGSLHASLDSLDQGVFAIEASAVKYANGQLNLEVASVGAQYEAKVSLDHKLIDGTWSQGEATLPLVFRREPPAHKPADAVSAVEGLWQSALDMHGMHLRLQLHVSHDTEGLLIGALDNLDQGVTGLPAINVTEKGSAFHFEIPAVGATFDGTLNAAKNALAGEWSMGLTTDKLEFKRSDQPSELRRPQTPTKPYPYREDEVAFRNEAADVTLAGTLTLPKGAGPFRRPC